MRRYLRRRTSSSPELGVFISALFCVCIALMIRLPSSEVCDMELRKCFTAPKHFCTNGRSCFVLSMMCLLDAEHTENMPNVGHLLYSDY